MTRFNTDTDEKNSPHKEWGKTVTSVQIPFLVTLLVRVETDKSASHWDPASCLNPLLVAEWKSLSTISFYYFAQWMCTFFLIFNFSIDIVIVYTSTTLVSRFLDEPTRTYHVYLELLLQMILCTCEQFYGQRVSCFRLELQSLQLRPPHLTAAVALQGSSAATLHCQVMAVHCKCAYFSILVHTWAPLTFHKVFRHIVKKKEKVPSFPGFCIKYCAGLCSTLTVCRFPVSFVAHSCLLCHALHIVPRLCIVGCQTFTPP